MATAAALLLLAGAAGALAADEVRIDLDREPASRWLGEQHYGVFRGETRVGWLRRGLERVEWEGRPAVRRTVETHVSIAGDGNDRDTTERAVYLLEGRQLLVEIERRVESQGRVGARRVVRRDGRFDVVTSRDGEDTTGAVTAIDVTLADELVTELTVASAATREGGPEGAGGTAVALDLTRLQPLRRELSVRGTETAADGATLYRVAVATGPDTWSDPVVVDRDGVIVVGDLGGGLAIRRMPKDEALADLGRSSIEVAERVPMAGRLGDVLTIRELEISMPAPAAGLPTPFPRSDRQLVETFDGRLHLRVRAEHGEGEPTEAEREAALRPEGRIDSDHPALLAAATKILAGTARDAVRVARLLEFTARHLEDAVAVDEPTASQLLQLRHGDCTEHARLFVALARASGIPAREVTGLIWLDDEQQTFGWHAWAEVELNGRWRPVDPTRGRAPAHAAHLRVDPAARAAGVLTGVRFVLHEALR